MIFFDGFHGLPGRIHNRKYAERFLFGEFLRYHFFKHGKQFVEKTVRIQNYDGFFMLFQLSVITSHSSSKVPKPPATAMNASDISSILCLRSRMVSVTI